jgi:hypothetical protein
LRLRGFSASSLSRTDSDSKAARPQSLEGGQPQESKSDAKRGAAPGPRGWVVSAMPALCVPCGKPGSRSLRRVQGTSHAKPRRAGKSGRQVAADTRGPSALGTLAEMLPQVPPPQRGARGKPRVERSGTLGHHIPRQSAPTGRTVTIREHTPTTAHVPVRPFRAQRMVWRAQSPGFHPGLSPFAPVGARGVSAPLSNVTLTADIVPSIVSSTAAPAPAATRRTGKAQGGAERNPGAPHPSTIRPNGADGGDPSASLPGMASERGALEGLGWFCIRDP